MTKKQFWTDQEKLAHVQSVVSGVLTARQAAAASGVPLVLLRSWLRQFRAGMLGASAYVGIDLWLDEVCLLDIELQLQGAEPLQSKTLADWILDLVSTELGVRRSKAPLQETNSSSAEVQPTESDARWTQRRKRELTRAILGGRLTLQEACAQHGLSPGIVKGWLARNSKIERARCRVEIERVWLKRMEPHFRREGIQARSDLDAAVEWIRRLIHRRLGSGTALMKSPKGVAKERPYSPRDGRPKP